MDIKRVVFLVWGAALSDDVRYARLAAAMLPLATYAAAGRLWLRHTPPYLYNHDMMRPCSTLLVVFLPTFFGRTLNRSLDTRNAFTRFFADIFFGIRQMLTCAFARLFDEFKNSLCLRIRVFRDGVFLAVVHDGCVTNQIICKRYRRKRNHHYATE